MRSESSPAEALRGLRSGSSCAGPTVSCFSALCLYFSLITTVLLSEPTDDLFGGGACGGGGCGARASVLSDWPRGLFGGVSLCDQEVRTGVTGARLSVEQTHRSQKMYCYLAIIIDTWKLFIYDAHL